MREQIKLTFTVGIELTAHISADRLAYAIAKAASRLCGGCTIRQDRGFWKEDGAVRKDTFDGELKEETAIVLELTCEPEKADAVYAQMSEYLKETSQGMGEAFSWVHVIQETVVGRHFDATAPAMSRSQYRDLVSPGTRFAHA